MAIAYYCIMPQSCQDFTTAMRTCPSTYTVCIYCCLYRHSAACPRLPSAELQGHVAGERGDHGGVPGRLLARLHLPAAAEARHLDAEGHLAAAQARRSVQRLYGYDVLTVGYGDVVSVTLCLVYVDIQSV